MEQRRVVKSNIERSGKPREGRDVILGSLDLPFLGEMTNQQMERHLAAAALFNRHIIVPDGWLHCKGPLSEYLRSSVFDRKGRADAHAAAARPRRGPAPTPAAAPAYRRRPRRADAPRHTHRPARAHRRADGRSAVVLSGDGVRTHFPRAAGHDGSTHLLARPRLRAVFRLQSRPLAGQAL